jgi:vacuolar-type H+-ATPase subunit F/Vma7
MDVAVIADEITAVGWRLAGARVLTPAAEELSEYVRTALHDTDLVLITAEIASQMPESQLQTALLSEHPLLLIIADVRHDREAPDLEAEVQRALGVTL